MRIRQFSVSPDVMCMPTPLTQRQVLLSLQIRPNSLPVCGYNIPYIIWFEIVDSGCPFSFQRDWNLASVTIWNEVLDISWDGFWDLSCVVRNGVWLFNLDWFESWTLFFLILEREILHQLQTENYSYLLRRLLRSRLCCRSSICAFSGFSSLEITNVCVVNTNFIYSSLGNQTSENSAFDSENIHFVNYSMKTTSSSLSSFATRLQQSVSLRVHSTLIALRCTLKMSYSALTWSYKDVLSDFWIHMQNVWDAWSFYQAFKGKHWSLLELLYMFLFTDISDTS